MRINKLKNYLGLSLVALAFVILAPQARAATLFMSPANGQVAIGQTFDVELRVDSNDQGFNAAQGTIQFPANLLQVKSLDTSPSASLFNFWLQGPTFSNTSGQITFLGGTTNGVVGASIQILKITFIAKSAGEVNLTASDAAITASDGSGTNILNTVAGAKLTVSPTVITPTASTSTLPAIATNQTPATTEIVIPKPIDRKPTVATQAPAAPKLTVPLYPDQTKWYNQLSNFLVKWDLPSDIAGISVIVDKNAKTDPPAKSAGLYDAKALAPLSDGIWYLHAKLKNNVDWSPTTHYKVSIDTVPPLPFTVSAREGAVTDNPTPTLDFKTSDGLSGLANYEIRVNDAEPIMTTDSSSTLPIQTPGKKKIMVRAIDNAGNIREGSLDLEIMPIAGPTITPVSGGVFANESNLTVAGTALPNSTVWLTLKNSDNAEIAKIQASADAQGNWGTQFSGPFAKGGYFIEAWTQDSRGASSLPIQSASFQIKEKPLLIIAGIAISQLWFFVALIALLLAAVTIGWWSSHLWRRQLARKTVIAERDLINVFNNLEQDLNKLIKLYTGSTTNEATASEIKFALKNMKNNLSKAQRYIIENIKEIGD